MGSVDKIDTRLRREHYGKIKTESGTRSASRLSLGSVDKIDTTADRGTK